MQFTGLPIETVAWLAGLAALFITVLYILKLRKRRIEVPYSALWGRVLAEKRQHTDWWRRLRRLLSWLLHIILAALLAFAMLGPHFDDEVLEQRHLLILLDNSASMGATDVTGAYDRFDLARKKAREILETVGGNDRVMVALYNNRVQPLGPFVADATLLDAALRAQSATANPTDHAQALQFAADSLRDRGPSELIILSDGAGAQNLDLDIDLDPQINLRHIKIGHSSENLAITAFNARRYPSNRLDHELYAEVRSYFDRPIDATLEIHADDRLVAQHDLHLEPHGTHRQFYPGQAAAGERLEARVRLKSADARDVFPLDDRAFATVPPPTRQRVQLVSTGNLFIEGPLLLSPHVDYERVHPDNYDPRADVDITIFDAVAPEMPENGHILYLGPPQEGSPFSINSVEKDPIITDVRKSHPLLRWVTLKDLNISRSQSFTRTKDDTDVASSFGKSIIIARDTGQRRMVALGFDLRHSDFPLRVSFPVFILNVLDFFAQDDVDLLHSHTTGQTWSIPVDRTATSATVHTPDGQEIGAAIHDGRALFYGETPGFYKLQAGQSSRTVAANLASPDESDIAPFTFELPQHTISTETSGLFFDRRELWIYLLLATLALLMLEWLTFNRRWTV